MITLGEVWAAIREAIQLLLNLLGLANIIKGNTDKAAQENVPFSIDTNSSITVAAVTDSVIGLGAIKTAIDTLTSNQATEFADIMAAIAAVQQSGVEVTLPVAFPAGWGVGTGDAVWDWLDPVNMQQIYTYVLQAGDLAHYKGAIFSYDVSPFAPWPWRVNGGWDQTGASDPNPSSPPAFDFTTILQSDATALDWVNRVYPSWGAFDLGDGLPSVNNTGSGNWYWTLYLPATDWYVLKQSLGLLLTSTPVAPVWPGLANVTLGSTTALTNGLMLTGPMDGVIVAILSAPPGKAKYAYGLINAYQHIAALSFTDDDGHQEHFQAIQFESQIYVPTTMVIAAGVIFRVDPAVTGTVTPWTIT